MRQMSALCVFMICFCAIMAGAIFQVVPLNLFEMYYCLGGLELIFFPAIWYAGRRDEAAWRRYAKWHFHSGKKLKGGYWF